MNVIDRIESGKCYIGDTVVIRPVSKGTSALNQGASNSKIELKTPYYYPFHVGEYFLIRTTSNSDEQNRWRKRVAGEPTKTRPFLKINESIGEEFDYPLKFEETFKVMV